MAADKFWSRVNKTDGCWEWTGCLHSRGYGWLTVATKQYRAHRYAWVLVNGPIPNGLWVLHKCDNRKCCNPDHLYLGTNKQNMLDCRNRFRMANQKLTCDDVRSIRKVISSGEKTRKQIMAEYDISAASLGNLLARKVWADV